MRTRRLAWMTWTVALWALGACDAGEEQQRAALCGQASEYLTQCTGVSDADFEANCQTDDAQILLETPCEVLQEASGALGVLKADGWGHQNPFTCRVFNLGCPPEEQESCGPEVSDWILDDLIVLSEPTSVTGPLDVQFRVNAIAEIFRWEGDPRGLFATVYRLITNRAVESVEDGDYEHPEWAHNLITEFGRRYLANLHAHLTGGEPTPQWAKYYGLAQDCSVGRARTLGVAIAVHLMVDLPYTLYEIDSRPEQRDDFVLFGDILLEIFPDLITDVQADYDTDARGLLNGFFLGEWIDGLTSEGTTTAFIYQGVRLKAWRDSQNLRRFPHWMVRSDILTAWGMGEVALAILDAQGAL